MFFRGCCTLKKTYHYRDNIHKHSLKTWNVVFFGSDNFSLDSLKELISVRNKDVIGKLDVVTTNINTAVYKFSEGNNIKVHLWPPELTNSYDIGVIVSFGKLIPDKLIKLFPLGIINVHASLLPKWRGAMPIVHSIKNGETMTGITIQRIKPDAFDTGDIIHRRLVPIGRNELLPSLHAKLSKCGSECLIEVIKGLPGSLLSPEPQITEEATYARKIPKADAVVRWKECTAEEVYNLYRAFFGIRDLQTTWKGKPLKLICLSLSGKGSTPLKDNLDPGTITYDKADAVLLVSCKGSSPVRVCSLRFKNKLYRADQFHRGFLCTNGKNWTFGD